MSKKVTSEMLRDLINEVIKEEKRLDEFKLTIPKTSSTRLKFNQALGMNDQDFKDAAGATSYSKAYPKYKDLAKAGTDPSKINDDDFKSAWDLPDTDDLNQFADAIADKSTAVSDSDWANMGGINNPKSSTAGDGDDDGSITWTYGELTSVEKTKNNKSYKKKAVSDWIDKYLGDSNTNDATLTAIIQAVNDEFSDLGSIITKAIARAQARLSSDPATDVLRTALKDISSKLKTVEPEFVANPQLVDVGSDKGSFPPGIVAPFNSFFKGKNTIADRLTGLQTMSKNLVEQGASLYGASDKRQFLNDVIVMDYLTTIFKQLDDRAAAYYFEAVCALIGGHKVMGGDNKAGDFMLAGSGGDAYGSSKFIGDGSATSQAVSGFIPNEPVLYLVTQKKAKTSPEERDQLVLRAFTVELVKEPSYGTTTPEPEFNTYPAGLSLLWKGSPAESTMQSAGGSTIKKGDKIYTLKMNSAVVNGGEKFVITLASSADKESFRKSLESSISSNADVKDAYEQMRKYFKNMMESDAALKNYLATDDLIKGSEALEKFDEADSGLESVFTKLGRTVDRTKGVGQKVTEQKVTSSMLKKLIEENFKK